MSEFLKTLLNQDNAIITSRTNAILPIGVKSPDLDLDTIGFGSDEVTNYIKNAFTDHETRRYDRAKLLQGLVRIPIQLDAFCFTCDDNSTKPIPETMTAVYEAIKRRLWKKDLLNLKKTKGLITHTIRSLPDVYYHIRQERNLVEALAFFGMVRNIIDFGQNHRKEISAHFPIPDEYLWLDSILGMIDSKALKYPSLKHGKYKDLEPAAFLRKYKYDARYDIFWRFVAGLIRAEDDKQKIDFFEMIEAEPRDLLGPTHQRLVMHCLSKVPSQSQPEIFEGFPQIRKRLERQLSKWLLFECEFMKASRLACDMELPEDSLMMAFQQATEKTRALLVQSIRTRPRIASSATGLASLWVAECGPGCLNFTVFDLLQQLRQPLTNDLFQAIAVRLGDNDWCIRNAALKVLRN
ncbi:hypothetical protein BJ170DRAFT_599219 [Xylariales sp. AK1849]|nr:hypothetical protein BJ170DRAFT_599219 [Xylariales sp. AK1849]